MVLDAALLKIRHYKVGGDNPGKGVERPSTLTVVANEKGTVGSSLITVATFTYLHIAIVK